MPWSVRQECFKSASVLLGLTRPRHYRARHPSKNAAKNTYIASGS